MLQGDRVELTGEILHHVRDVCRQRLGDRFEVILDGVNSGQAILVEVIGERKGSSIARVLSSRALPELPVPHLELVLAIPRLPVFEAVIEKAVELGVKSLQPVFSEFSFIRSDERVLTQKQERFGKIVRSATQQSGRGDLMRILPPRSLEEILQPVNREASLPGLFAYEGEGRLSLRDALKAVPKASKKLSLFVGAEGGYSAKEVELFRTVEMLPVSLGAQVLRVETACVAMISIIKYELGL